MSKNVLQFNDIADISYKEEVLRYLCDHFAEFFMFSLKLIEKHVITKIKPVKSHISGHLYKN